MSNRRILWSLADLTELDLRLREEITLTPADLKPGADLPRSEVLRCWLNEQQRQHPEPTRTAQRLVQIERILRLIVFGLLFFSGVGAALGLLHYEGDRLINVSLYLGTLVFGQLGLLLLLFFSRALLRRSAGSMYDKILFHFFEGKTRENGPMEPMRSLPAWSARTFASMQLAGAGFNLGVLSATAIKGLTSDLAFGWATTLDLGAEHMARLTSALAAPWGGAFSPTPEQIAASRIVLKEGLELVDPRAAAAWWPFLLLCVLVYGLLPRLVLAIAGEIQFRLKLRKARLDDPACERLYLRLTRKSLQFQAMDPTEAITTVSPEPLGEAIRPLGAVHVMMSPEIEMKVPALSKAVEGLLEIPVATVSEFPALPETVPQGGVVLMQELWQPPLEESLYRLRELRETLPPNTDITLVGLGYPEEGRVFTAPDTTDVQVWHHALARLSDPHLQLVAWPVAHLVV